MDYQVTLQKRSLRRLNADVIRKNVEGILRRALAGNRSSKWASQNWQMPEPKVEGNFYVYSIVLTFKKKKASISDEEFDVVTQMSSGACSGNGQWSVIGNDGQVVESVNLVEEEVERKEIPIGKLCTDIRGGYFKEIYDREAQIQIIHSALVAFKESNKLNRYHACLFGPPASGKTEILLAMARMLGEDAVLKLDMTNTTSAGINRILLESEFLPQVIICEELEKQHENLLTWLLALLDSRGEIRKTNYRIGTQSRQINALVFATVNNINLFNSACQGALSSRFPNKIYCPRPSVDILRKILLREVRKVDGNEDWIDHTIQYCQEHNIDDPREATTICLCGRDKLKTGKYQQYLLATRMPEKL